MTYFLTQTLVELHNGNLACVSTRRDASMHDNQLSGSEFYFTLPHDPKAVPTPTFTSKSRRSISTRSNTGADSSDSNAKRGSVQTPSSSSKSTLLSVQEASRVEPTSVPPHTGIVVERALVVDGKIILQTNIEEFIVLIMLLNYRCFV